MSRDGSWQVTQTVDPDSSDDDDDDDYYYALLPAMETAAAESGVQLCQSRSFTMCIIFKLLSPVVNILTFKLHVKVTSDSYSSLSFHINCLLFYRLLHSKYVQMCDCVYWSLVVMTVRSSPLIRSRLWRFINLFTYIYK